MSANYLRSLGGVVLFIAGCGEQHFRAETVWHEDGRVERAIYQPAEFLPEEAKSKWSVVQPAGEVSSDAFTGSIRTLPVDRSGESRHVTAWGSFPSPESVPDSLRIPAADPTKAGTLERRCTVDDLGLVIEYRWSETLTDVVSLADMAAARREFTALVADVFEIALQDEEQFKSAEFLRWLREDAARWFEELHAVFVEAAQRGWLRREHSSDSPLPDRLADVSAPYGLNVRTPDGALLADEDLKVAIGRFLIEKVRSTVTASDGKPLDEQQARAFLSALGLTDPEQLTWNASPNLEKAIVTRFGTDEAAQQKSAELATRLFGVYRLGSFQPRRPLRYELEMPGAIIETTGERVADRTVVWRFEAPDAFPFGYTMAARSLVPNEAVQKTVLGSVRLRSLEQLSKYASLMRADSSLLAVMRQCAAAGTLEPLERYEANLSEGGDVDPVIAARNKALRRLLSTPAKK